MPLNYGKPNPNNKPRRYTSIPFQTNPNPRRRNPSNFDSRGWTTDQTTQSSQISPLTSITYDNRTPCSDLESGSPLGEITTQSTAPSTIQWAKDNKGKALLYTLGAGAAAGGLYYASSYIPDGAIGEYASHVQSLAEPTLTTAQEYAQSGFESASNAASSAWSSVSNLGNLGNVEYQAAASGAASYLSDFASRTSGFVSGYMPDLTSLGNAAATTTDLALSTATDMTAGMTGMNFGSVVSGISGISGAPSFASNALLAAGAGGILYRGLKGKGSDENKNGAEDEETFFDAQETTGGSGLEAATVTESFTDTAQIYASRRQYLQDLHTAERIRIDLDALGRRLELVKSTHMTINSELESIRSELDPSTGLSRLDSVRSLMDRNKTELLAMSRDHDAISTALSALAQRYKPVESAFSCAGTTRASRTGRGCRSSGLTDGTMGAGTGTRTGTGTTRRRKTMYRRGGR